MASAKLTPLTWGLALALLATPTATMAASCPTLPRKPTQIEVLRRHICLTGNEDSPDRLRGQDLYDRFYYLLAAEHYASKAAKSATGEAKDFYRSQALHYDSQVQAMWTRRHDDLCTNDPSGTSKLFASIYPQVRGQCLNPAGAVSFGSSSGTKVKRISDTDSATAEDIGYDDFVEAVNQGRDLGPVLIDSTEGWVLIDGATTAYVDRSFVDTATSELPDQPRLARNDLDDLDDLVAIAGTLSESQHDAALTLISSASATQTRDMLALSQFILAHPQFAAAPLPAVDPEQLRAAQQRVSDVSQRAPKLQASAELLTSAMLGPALEDALLQPQTTQTRLSIEYDGKTFDDLILHAVDRQHHTATFESESAKLEVRIDRINALAPSD